MVQQFTAPHTRVLGGIKRWQLPGRTHMTYKYKWYKYKWVVI